MRTMGFRSGFLPSSAASGVDLMRYGFKMIRVNAKCVAAKMIDLKTIGYGPLE